MKFVTVLAITSAAALLHTAAFAQTSVQVLPQVDLEIDKPEPQVMADADAMILVEDKVNSFTKPTVAIAEADAEVKILTADAATEIEGPVLLADGTEIGEIDTLVRDDDGTLASVVVLVRGDADASMLELTGEDADIVNGQVVLTMEQSEFLQLVEIEDNAG
ncbi:hypothetical protein [Pontivivens insulae]|uniref:PRC-barrel domain-containing protein n=1 Tax=Pontivivens insulae TaxID=1639689 RepID=A0A2R8AAK9_9RHOB|nr:hypothetical protein [Pontivivens insulae]RED13164.1 hypothetical protein DFR53_2299 [Pontivivens insulae]SPF29256.1 hypothetical protein POI8812_01563 [Pontivivens insulae]